MNAAEGALEAYWNLLERVCEEAHLHLTETQL
jgi:hypothetical protein